MPLGKLAIFDEGEISGTIETNTQIKPTVLDYQNDEFTYKLDMENLPSKIYIQVNVSYSKKTSINKWRIWLDEFSLTREFKPNLLIDTELGYFASLLYDITPLIGNKKGKHEITLSYSGSDKLVVDSISTISLYNSEGFKTKYKLHTGCLLLQPGENYELNSLGRAYFILKNLEKGAKLEIMTQSRKLSNEAYEDGEIDEIEIETHGDITLFLEKAQKKPVVITSYYTYETRSPKIDLNLLPKLNSEKLDLKIENNSEIDLDKVIINVLANGITTYFKVLQPFKINQNEDIQIAIPQNKKSNITIRAVAVKSGLRKTFDVKVV
ncbi:MAG: hypothetical protein OWQ54_01015 [Sulfolobaceae archaeon]|nr:hypothetical protein [Sulfolobaceae archaeon]